MDWFQHSTGSHEDPDLSDAWDKFGDAAVTVFWTTLEIYGKEYKNADENGELKLSMGFVSRKMRRKFSKFQKIFEFFQDRGRFCYRVDGDFIYLIIPKFIKIASNWTKRPTPTPTETPTEVTTEAPTAKEKEEKKNKKNIYADSVSMTEEEYNKLLSQNGEYITKQAIILLSNYKLSSGKRYKSDYHAILTWALDKAKGAGNGQSAGRPWLRPTPAEDPEVISDVEAINARFRAKQMARGIAEKSAIDKTQKDAK